MNFILHNFDWVTGILAIVLQFFIIKKCWWAPIAGLLYQPVWVIYIIITGEYGFILPTIMFAVLYAYGTVKWTKERRIT